MIVFRVRKQWYYSCHVLICMVKTIVCSSLPSAFCTDCYSNLLYSYLLSVNTKNEEQEPMLLIVCSQCAMSDPHNVFVQPFFEQQWYHHAYIIYYYYFSGLTKCNECSWNNGQIRLAWLKKPFVVHPSNMCNKWRWIIWRSWLAFQWVEKEKKLKVKVRKSLYATRHIWEWPLGWKQWKHSLTLKQLWL